MRARVCELTLWCVLLRRLPLTPPFHPFPFSLQSINKSENAANIRHRVSLGTAPTSPAPVASAASSTVQQIQVGKNEHTTLPCDSNVNFLPSNVFDVIDRSSHLLQSLLNADMNDASFVCLLCTQGTTQVDDSDDDEEDIVPNYESLVSTFSGEIEADPVKDILVFPPDDISVSDMSNNNNNHL